MKRQSRTRGQLRPLMVLGCTSDAGKSLIATALCRWFARQGVRVAPFKAQNMSNNARVAIAENGEGEIGVAQWLQAKAARVRPEVRMNPVLLKPESETRSQVIVRGALDLALSALPWDARHDALWTPMAESFDSLAGEFDLVVIEGAGSPAEINLPDQVNNRMIEHADAGGLLVSDIDRGGSFAHLYGTWALVPGATRERILGYVLNKFRGDAGLLAPGPALLTEKTGMPYAGVLPMLVHDLPREEGATEVSSAPPGSPRIVIPRLPFGSNLDEFQLASTAARVLWATSAAAFDELDPETDLIVLPGSKSVAADLDWMKSRGLSDAAVRASGRGVRIIGVCGGAMMMGHTIEDPDGVEGGSAGTCEGLGLLDIRTRLTKEKRTLGVTAALGQLPGRWESLSGLEIEGYEIRIGAVSSTGSAVAHHADAIPVAWCNEHVLATTVHGLFEDTRFLEAVLRRRVTPILEPTLERLADAVEEHLDTALLRSMIGA